MEITFPQNSPLIHGFVKKKNQAKEIIINHDKSTNGKITYFVGKTKKEETIQFKNLNWWFYKYDAIDTQNKTVKIHSCNEKYCFRFNSLDEQQKFISLVHPSQNAAAFNVSVTSSKTKK